MVKGTTRQVILVRAPDEKLFEQALFILREDALEKNGVGERELLEQARRAADGYLSRRTQKKRRALPPLLWGALGAAPVGAAWLLTVLL